MDGPREFQGEPLREAVFEGVDVQGASFRLVDLSGTRRHNVDLPGARLRGVVLQDAVIDGDEVLGVRHDWSDRVYEVSREREHRLLAERDLGLLAARLDG